MPAHSDVELGCLKGHLDIGTLRRGRDVDRYCDMLAVHGLFELEGVRVRGEFRLLLPARLLVDAGLCERVLRLRRARRPDTGQRRLKGRAVGGGPVGDGLEDSTLQFEVVLDPIDLLARLHQEVYRHLPSFVRVLPKALPGQHDRFRQVRPKVVRLHCYHNLLQGFIYRHIRGPWPCFGSPQLKLGIVLCPDHSSCRMHRLLRALPHGCEGD
mmetsp:Transcript_23405/g.65500  ORF Transcript_23405/g.65500 Transcript_23405/m.65500 type:complete len:212 (+) Transcript_23405:213-848(+)